MQHTAGQIWNRKSGPSAGTKSSEQGETITFADIAGVDEAKEELEEIVVSWTLLSFSSLTVGRVFLRLFIMQLNLIFSFLVFLVIKGFNMLMFTCQEFLRNPDRYVRLGARPPRGVLLVSSS